MYKDIGITSNMILPITGGHPVPLIPLRLNVVVGGYPAYNTCFVVSRPH